MKAVLPMLALLIASTASVNAAQAQDSAVDAGKDAKLASPATGFFPGGGWDGNNLRVSVTRGSKLISKTGK